MPGTASHGSEDPFPGSGHLGLHGPSAGAPAPSSSSSSSPHPGDDRRRGGVVEVVVLLRPVVDRLDVVLHRPVGLGLGAQADRPAGHRAGSFEGFSAGSGSGTGDVSGSVTKLRTTRPTIGSTSTTSGGIGRPNLAVEEGQPVRDRGAAQLRASRAGHRVGRGVRAHGAAALDAGRRRSLGARADGPAITPAGVPTSVRRVEDDRARRGRQPWRRERGGSEPRSLAAFGTTVTFSTSSSKSTRPGHWFERCQISSRAKS